MDKCHIALGCIRMIRSLTHVDSVEGNQKKKNQTCSHHFSCLSNVERNERYSIRSNNFVARNVSVYTVCVYTH